MSDVLLFLAAHLLGSALTTLGGIYYSYGEVVGPTAKTADEALSAEDYFLPGFFLPAMARRGPLRVRAFVLVR